MSATATRKKINLKPLGDRVLVEREQAAGVSPGGVILPEQSKEKPGRGTIIECGPGRTLADGTYGNMQVKPGDRILFNSFAAEPIDLSEGDDETELVLLRESDIMALIG